MIQRQGPFGFELILLAGGGAGAGSHDAGAFGDDDADDKKKKSTKKGTSQPKDRRKGTRGTDTEGGKGGIGDEEDRCGGDGAAFQGGNGNKLYGGGGASMVE